uniref:Protein SPT2 n=1 Tax=Panagrellus redivivus TaxID=6233 RepID=A0A7E5A0B7_PANRE
MSDDESPPSPSAPPVKVYNAPHIGGYMDLKYRVLADSAKAEKQGSKSFSDAAVKKTKKNLFGVSKEAKEKAAAADEARRQRIREAEAAMELDEKERERQQRMAEKAAAYEKLKKGDRPRYDDGTDVDYLVDFARRSRSRSPIREHQRSRSISPRPGPSTQWPVSNGASSSTYYEPPAEHEDAVYYDPREDAGRQLGAGFYHLPKQVDARVEKIRELEETSRQTVALRLKKKAARKEKKREELISINLMREVEGLPPLEPSSDEDEPEEHPGANLDVNAIPLPGELPQEEQRRINEQKKREADLEWDKGKARELKWLQDERDYRDDEFRPPDSYFSSNHDQESAFRQLNPCQGATGFQEAPKKKVVVKSPTTTPKLPKKSKAPSTPFPKKASKLPESDSESDADFDPSAEDHEEEDFHMSEDEINQELMELGDEAAEHAMLQGFQDDFIDEDEKEYLEKQRKTRQSKTSKTAQLADDGSNDSEDDEDFKPAYEEVSEDDAWAEDDMAVEAVELLKESEEHEAKSKKTEKPKKKVPAVKNTAAAAKAKKILAEIDSDEDEDDDAEDVDDDAEDIEFDEEDLFGDDSDAESEEQKLDGEEDLKDAESGEDEEEDDGNYQEELKKLLDADPEFKKYVETEEKDLLDFKEESDDEEPTGDGRIEVTLEMVEAAVKAFTDPKTSKKVMTQQVKFAVKAFCACLMRVADMAPASKYVVNEDKVFDNVVRMCYAYVAPVILTLLDPIPEVKKEEAEDTPKFDPTKKDKPERKAPPKYKNWREFSTIIKQFLHCLNLFLVEATSKEIMHCTLRAIVDNIGLYVHFERISRNLIKSLVRVWSRKTQDCRCLAFIALCKLIRFDGRLFSTVYKSCYVAYVANTRGMSEAATPLITFMQRSFATLTFVDPAVAYQYAFVYIRQCAIHLRNATIAKRKDLIKTIYNWQFVACLYLWTAVLSTLSKPGTMVQEGSRWLRDLVHPLIQIIAGTMKAFNAHRYVPLKCHCVRMLLQLQINCNVYIPTLAYAAELLTDLQRIDSNKGKRSKTGANKQYQIRELIKFNSDALEESWYRDRLADEIRELLVEAAHALRHSVAFADVYAPIGQQLRSFVKAYKNPVQSIAFKKVVTTLKTHADQVELLVNARGIDLKSSTDLERFGKAVDAATNALNVLHAGYASGK